MRGECPGCERGCQGCDPAYSRHCLCPGPPSLVLIGEGRKVYATCSRCLAAPQPTLAAAMAELRLHWQVLLQAVAQTALSLPRRRRKR